jgi:hypothetical protein
LKASANDLVSEPSTRSNNEIARVAGLDDAGSTKVCYV